MAMKDQTRRLQNELRRLEKRSRNQKDAWRIVGGMVYRRLAVEWFRKALGLRTRGGGPRDNPWRALKSESYIRRKLKKNRTKKLVYTGTFRESYFSESYNDHALVGIRDFRKAGWLEKMGFEVLALENDIKDKAYKVITDFIWNK